MAGVAGTRQELLDRGHPLGHLVPPWPQLLVDRLDHQQGRQELELRLTYALFGGFVLVEADARRATELQVAEVGRQGVPRDLLPVGPVAENDRQHHLKEIRFGVALLRRIGGRLADGSADGVAQIVDVAVRVTRQERPEDGARPVEIGARVIAATVDELGGNVLHRRTHGGDLPVVFRREDRVLKAPQLHQVAPPHLDDDGRFRPDTTMDHPRGVDRGEGLDQLARDPRGALGVETPRVVRDELADGLALERLVDDERPTVRVRARIDDALDVAVRDAPGDPALANQTRGFRSLSRHLGSEDLDEDLPLNRDVLRVVSHRLRSEELGVLQAVLSIDQPVIPHSTRTSSPPLSDGSV